ncbi:MAG: ethanolamine ammonia-lyase reactivating factor EutA [Synergistaceae bacterium]|nr:ethanolamine ammonia-lyase reactivating factor EutA [Synergistaceae bacterium]
MPSEIINSVGIDIGTSTTQLIFSRLVVENRASSYSVPRVEIIDKKVVYWSDIYFTPLLSPEVLDVNEIKKIVQDEYRKANMTPSMLQSGAVIITGEAARKENANEVLRSLSDSAGDFVVATAGPALESVLSARGAGTDTMSRNRGDVVVNLDLGGGTANIAAYNKGTLLGVTCLDIGGRLIKVENGRITYIYHKIKKLADDNNIRIEVGSTADVSALRKLTTIMAAILAESLSLTPRTALSANFYTNDGKPLPQPLNIDAVTFSGGVADFIYHPDAANGNIFKYNDIGALLGEAIRENACFKQVERLEPAETIRATVVGAGVHTTEISGSTISFAEGYLPIKNVPVLNITEEDETTPERILASMKAQMPLFKPEGQLEQIAISFGGWSRNSFDDIQILADTIIKGSQEVIQSKYPLILVLENDIAKALGHALNVKLNRSKPVICVDGIKTLSGDYIDIGEPVLGGRVLPVVIKTLVFNS